MCEHDLPCKRESRHPLVAGSVGPQQQQKQQARTKPKIPVASGRFSIALATRSMDAVAQEHPAWFVKVPDVWLNIFFDPHAAGEFWRNAVAATRALELTMLVASAKRQKGPPEASPHLPDLSFEQTSLRARIMSTVLQRDLSLMHPNAIKEFPGPMAVSLGRKHFPLLQNNDYLITEKSDGIRCMMLCQREEWFPKWFVKYTDTRNSRQKRRPFMLQDNLALESAFQQLRNQLGERPVLPVTLSCGSVMVQLVRLQAADTQGRPTEQETLNILPADSRRLHDATTYHDIEESQREEERNGHLSVAQIMRTHDGTVELRRTTGWSFAYMFDRTFDLYLCMEEIPFCTDSVTVGVQRQCFQKTGEGLVFSNCVLCDGELVFNMQAQKHNYSIYDLVAAGRGGGLCRTEQSCVFFGNEDMRTKVKVIKELLIDPFYAFMNYLRPQPFPASMKIVAKHFYEKRDLPQLMSFIQRDPSNPHLFIYKNYNHNDGLVFTPGSSRLYTFLPGRADHLLKWKWPERLTVDFLLRRAVPLPTANRLWNMYYSDSNETVVLYKTIQVAPSDEAVVASAAAAGHCLIAECCFDGDDWTLSHVRTDKTSPNGFRTFLATMENIVEGITEADLCQCCGCQQNGSSSLPALPQTCFLSPETVPDRLLAHLRLSRKENSRRHGHSSVASSSLADSASLVLEVHVRTAAALSLVTSSTDEHSFLPPFWRTVAVLKEDSLQFASEGMRQALVSPSTSGSLMTVRCWYSATHGQWFVLDGLGRPDWTDLEHFLKCIEECVRVAAATPAPANQRQGRDPTSPAEDEDVLRRRCQHHDDNVLRHLL